MINEKRLINDFLELVKISSTTGNEKNLADNVLKRLLSLGLSAKKDKHGNVIAKNSGTENPIFLNAHLDTVSPGENIEPVIEKGFIKSKGDTILGADNKVAIAAILESLRLAKTRRKIEIAFTVSEESENIGALNLDYSQLKSKKGFCFDCGEKIGTIIMKSPFYDSFKIKIKGKEAHAAFPEKGVNALTFAANAISKMKTGKIDKESVVNIGKINGGSAVNTVPGEITLEGEVRSFDEKKIKNHEEKIKKSFQKSEKVKSLVKIKRENAGYVFKEEDSDISEVRKVFSSLGIKSHYKASWGCSDANIFNEKSIKVINLGEGAENIHTTKERVRKKDLVMLASLVVKLIEDFN